MEILQWEKYIFLLPRFSLTKSAAKVIKESVPLSLRTHPPCLGDANQRTSCIG